MGKCIHLHIAGHTIDFSISPISPGEILPIGLDLLAALDGLSPAEKTALYQHVVALKTHLDAEFDAPAPKMVPTPPVTPHSVPR